MKRAILIVVLAVLLTGVLGYIVYNNSDAVQFEKQMDLGHKYLEELDYEQAVVAFNQAIELEPMSVEAYMGLADAYIGMGNMDAALEALKVGYEITQSEEILARIQEMEEANRVEEPEEPIQVETPVSTIVEFPFTPEDFKFAGFSVVEENFDNITAALGLEPVWYDGWASDWYEEAGRNISADIWPDAPEYEGGPIVTRCDVTVDLLGEQDGLAGYSSIIPVGEGVYRRTISCSAQHFPDIINSPITVGMSREEVEEILCIEEIKNKEKIPGGAYDFYSSMGEGWFDILDGGYYEGDVLINLDSYTLAFDDYWIYVDVLRDEGIVHSWSITSSIF